MAKARTHGSGWHKESLRHSQARKTGKAGGKYENLAVQYTGSTRGQSVRYHPDDLAYEKKDENGTHTIYLQKHNEHSYSVETSIIPNFFTGLFSGNTGKDKYKFFKSKKEALAYVEKQKEVN